MGQPERISIAEATVRAHGRNPNAAPIVYDAAFTKANEVYPTPDGDAYLSVVGLAASQQGGTTVTVETPPGYIEHMQEVGVLPSDTKVIQRPITITDPEKVGHPASDPLALMVREGYRFDARGQQKPIYVSIFESPEVRRQAEALGLELLGRPDSTRVNNKAQLRKNARKYGVDMLPGAVVATWRDLERYVATHGGEKAWLKVSIGSGGDLVRPIQHLSIENAQEATRQMREAVQQAFKRGEFSMDIEEFWPEGYAAPLNFPSVIEEDAGMEGGKIEINASNAFITHQDGTIEYLGTYQQITSPEGEYMGSRIYRPGQRLMDLIREQTEAVARYNMVENRYFGIQGMDFFIMRDRHGEPRVRPIEVNSRPPISVYPEILMRNLLVEQDGYSVSGTWDNINLVSQRRHLDDRTTIPDLVGRGLAFGYRSGHGGRVLRQAIPLAGRALVYQNGHGEPPAVNPSGNIKMFVWGADERQKELALKELRDRGIVYQG